MIKNLLRLINKENITIALTAFIPAFIIILLVAFQPFHEPKIFLRDYNYRVYFGIVSNIGSFLWDAAAVIALIGALYAKKIGAKKTYQFLGFAAALSLFLMIDDFFMIHDRVFPHLLGLPEEIIYFFIIASTFFYLYLYYRMKNFYYAPVLLSALGFLFLSLSGDVFGLGYLFEDGTKFIGISMWFAFHWVTTWSLITKNNV